MYLYHYKIGGYSPAQPFSSLNYPLQHRRISIAKAIFTILRELLHIDAAVSCHGAFCKAVFAYCATYKYRREPALSSKFSTPSTEVRGLHGRRCIDLSLIHISEPTRLLSISYAVFCLK